MKASGLANLISSVMVHGFLIREEGQTLGIAHFSTQLRSLLKLTTSLPLPACRTTTSGNLDSIVVMASLHGASSNLILAKSAATWTGAVGNTYSGFKFSINFNTSGRPP